jgi:hypothetical protein
MKKISALRQLLLAAALFLAVPPCLAKVPPQPENRFLFIVDTAAAMRGCSNQVVQNVVELLDSDMRGEFRQGDTIGLWTYNDKLHTDFPMLVWSKGNKSTIAADIAVFLQGRRYEKRAHLENVMPALNLVIKSSERITVIFVYDGTGLIQGTPFDKDINDLQKKYARELRAAHRPFVTVLAARDGAVYDYTINYPGWVAIPHTANPEKPVAPVAPIVVVAPPVPVVPPKPRPMRSLIMSRATNTVPVAAPTAAPVVVAAPPLVVTPAPAPQPVAPVVTAPAPQTVVAPAPAPAPQPAVVVAVAPVPTPAPPQTQPTPPPVVAQQNPAPVIETPPPQTPPPASETVPEQPPPAAPVVAAAPVAPVAQNALAAGVPPAGNTPLALFIVAFSLLTIAVVLVVFLVRRSRHTPRPSLISQSIDRPR